MLSLLRRRRVLASVCAVAVLAGGGVLWVRGHAATPNYRLTTATKGTVTETVDVSGTLLSTGEADLDFTASGRVASVLVQPGDHVTAGETLATLDTTTLQQSVTTAQGQVSTAQAQLSSAQTQLADTEAVNSQSVAAAQATVVSQQNQVNTDQSQVDSACAGSGSGSTQCQQDQSQLSKDQAQLQSDVNALSAAELHARQSDDSAQAAVTNSQLALQNANNNLSTAQQPLGNATLVAPVAGVVGLVNIATGQTVSGTGGGGGSSSSTSSSSSGGGSSSSGHAITIIGPGQFEVQGTVSDTQVGLVAPGQRVRVTPAGATEAVDGKLTAVAAEATVSSGVASYQVRALLDPTAEGLHAGAAATMSIIVKQAVEVLTVPVSAVHSQGGQTYVEVPDATGTGTTNVQVTVGIEDTSRAEITQGLSEGQQIVLAVISSSTPTTSGGAGGFGFGGGARGGGGGGGGCAGRALGGG